MISVVMATYNGAQYIVEQLDSIRCQTICSDEVIICDDCSSDNTVEIISRYIERYCLSESWKIYCNEKNMGYASNFHQAVNLSNGDLIFFADQDDLWLPNKIKIMRDIMEKKLDCQVLCTDYEPFISSVNAPKTPKSVLKKMPNDGTLEKISIGKKSVYIGALGCCMCVRREFYQSIQKYWFSSWAQDDRMWRLSQCVEGCYLLHANLVKHRLHGNNTATYGKYHTIEKRGKLFWNMQYANKQMLKMLTENSVKNRKVNVVQKHIKMMELRIDLLENRKIENIFWLIPYLAYYQKIKSFILESYMAIKGR